jgi:hypothetical protein
MLATHKINIYTELLPIEISKIIEDYTETIITFLCKQLKEFILKIYIIDVFSRKPLKQIYLDDIKNETIKLSSDGTKLIYLDVNSNIVYYDINTTIKNKIKLLSGIFPNNYFFDRNGLYFVVSNNDTTYIFDINANKLLYELPFNSSIDNNEMNIIVSQNNRIFLRSDDNIYIYDLINGNRIYSLELNHLILANMSINGNLLIYSDNNYDSINIVDINNQNNLYNYKLEEEYYNIYNIKGIAFYKDSLVSLFLDHGLIVIINLKTKSKIDKEIDCFDLCNMEFTKDGKYLIIKIDDLIIETIKV